MKTSLIISTICGIIISNTPLAQELNRLTFQLEKPKEEILDIEIDTLAFADNTDGFGNDRDFIWRGERERVEYISVDISNQNLKNLPREYRKNRWISKLDMSNNQVDKLTRRFNNLRVDTLLLSGNKIEGLKKYWLVSNPLLFSNVSYLDLSNNLLETIPNISLRRVRYLNFSFNSITNVHLPNQCPMMEEIYLNNNEINKFYFKTSKYNSLRVIDLSNNLLKVFPKSIYRLKNIEELDLSNNRIEKLSFRICRMPNLKKLNLSGNSIPIDILERIELQLPEGCEFVF